MDEKKINERTRIIRNVFLFAFAGIIIKILYMNVIKYDYYTNLADNKTYKEVVIKAARGEIRDRYGRLLAGNENQFTVQVSINELTKNDTKTDKSQGNNISLKLINLLEKNKEKYTDEFPIVIENGEYYYAYDENIKKYKTDNNIPQDLNAKESFYYLVDRLIVEGKLSEDDRNLKPADLQKKVNEAGYYPPILVSKWTFTEDREKNDWLQGYRVDKWMEENKIKSNKVDAKLAFKAIRDYYLIDPSLSDDDARKILIVRDLIKSQGYTRYKPITIAKNISETTIATIEEMALELPGVSVSNEPVRVYPNGKLASHILGYLGKIPSTQEKEYLENKEKKYSKDDIVGLSGVEKTQESKLHGTDGYKKVKVDAVGNITENLEVTKPISGDTVYLTLDKDLQEVTESSLERAVNAAREGGVYKSEYGDVPVAGGATNAKSGAAIVVDVNSGEVLASASYPSYDPNLFVSGISSKDYSDLQPKNTNDLLAPSPLLNLVTQGVFQPGSTFKMITGMAALEHGLNPEYSISDPGVIWMGKKSYGDAVWNKSRSNHGITNLYKALQESCNIYFYTIGTGENRVGGANPNAKIGPKEVMEYAKLFGLDERTGLYEDLGIGGESKGKVPSEEAKIESTKSMLKTYLNKVMKNSFIDITKDKNPEEFAARIQQIANWCEEKTTPGKAEVLKRLEKLKVKEDDLEHLADQIVYTYLNFSKWTVSDAFNLAIGQGENAYTPAQIVRYISAIANGGTLQQLHVVQKSISSDYKDVDVKETKSEKIDFKNDDNLKDLIIGMKRVVTEGTGKSVLGNLGVPIAAKTGTAQKSTKIPTSKEYDYLMSHLSSYRVNKDEVLKEYYKLRAEREAELTKARIDEIKEQLASKDVDDETKAELEKELKEGVSEKLPKNDDRINAAYLRRAIKELNHKITDEDIDAFKETYGDFAWAVSFAPADDPEIAICVMIPQGNSSTYALLPMKDIIGNYMGLSGKSSNNIKNSSKDNTDKEDDNNLEEDNINFSTQLKK